MTTSSSHTDLQQVIEGADHLLTGKNPAARAARIISTWADPYL